MKRRFQFFIKILMPFGFLLAMGSCNSSKTDAEKKGEAVVTRKEPAYNEIFDPADRPSFIQNRNGNFFLCEPWNYNKDYNSARKYPLFIYLHGSGGSGNPSMLPCFQNDEDKKKYPSFVYLPYTDSSWDNRILIDQIETLKAAYRLDTDRIYLMGYSMGGSGAYALANEYYDFNGHLFAGIVRMAGQSQTTLREAIADKTSIWYHIGMSDSRLRIKVAKKAYSFLKKHPGNLNAVKTSGTVPPTASPGTTLTLTKEGVEIVKFTKYKSPVGHDISNVPLSDPYILEWLFGQSLELRN